jgi:signal recognition particle GTPase
MKVEDVNRLMKQFEEMQKFMKGMNARDKFGKRKRLPGLGGIPMNPAMMQGQANPGKRKK